jgi:hypothetical protein
LKQYAGAGPNVCYTALSSAKQKSATAHCYRAFQRNPCKGGVTNITACTCVCILLLGVMVYRMTMRHPGSWFLVPLSAASSRHVPLCGDGLAPAILRTSHLIRPIRRAHEALGIQTWGFNPLMKPSHQYFREGAKRFQARCTINIHVIGCHTLWVQPHRPFRRVIIFRAPCQCIECDQRLILKARTILVSSSEYCSLLHSPC